MRIFLYYLQQFKWPVKEARPLFKGRRDSGSAPADTNGYHDHDVSSDSIEHHYENGDVTYQHHYHSNGDHHHHHHDDVDSADDQVWRHNDDVIRADEPVEEEMPAPQTTRSMLAVFQSMEDVNRPPPTPEHAKRISKQATSPARAVSIRRGGSPPPSSSSHYSNHLNGHHGEDGYHGYPSGDQEHYDGGDYRDELYRDYDNDGGEFENEPLRNPDVVREDTANETEVLPEQGTTKNLLAKFQALQAI